MRINKSNFVKVRKNSNMISEYHYRIPVGVYRSGFGYFDINVGKSSEKINKVIANHKPMDPTIE
jgi:hypothetical protein